MLDWFESIGDSNFDIGGESMLLWCKLVVHDVDCTVALSEPIVLVLNDQMAVSCARWLITCA